MRIIATLISLAAVLQGSVTEERSITNGVLGLTIDRDAVITTIFPESDCSALRVGDFLVEVDGEELNLDGKSAPIIPPDVVGSTVKLMVDRDGGRMISFFVKRVDWHILKDPHPEYLPPPPGVEQ